MATSDIVGDTSSATGRTTANTGLPAGAERSAPSPATLNIRDAQGNIQKQDLRVKIKVPPSYLQPSTDGPYDELRQIQGIVFPYTPTITYDVKADYATLNPTHGNYTQYFYQKSSIGPINITGQFTVQNEKDAGVYLATIHLLKALTKMKFGTDSDAGSPPPVCRLSAYGEFMLKNVPVAIASFRVDLPNTVDYFTLGKLELDPIYGQASVPTSSSISLTCYPLFSRDELQKFSVNSWLREGNFRAKGYV
jgi:hypothetical protein